MKLLNQILRGVIIGVANIIPGVSGGTMMVSMGVYDTLIHCITHIFKEFKKSILTLLPYIIGMAVGILALAKLLNTLLQNPATVLPTNTAFIGLILGGLAPLFKKIERKKVNVVCVILFVLFFAAIIAMALCNEHATAETLDMSLGQVLLLVLIGAIASATMIIPGVSGSMMLMLLGYYTAVVGALSHFTSSALKLDFAGLGYPVSVLLPFAVGIVLGIFGVAKLIEWLTARFATPTYCAVLGLVLASPVALLMKDTNWAAPLTVMRVIISLVTFAAGFAVAWLLAKNSREEAAPAPEK